MFRRFSAFSSLKRSALSRIALARMHFWSIVAIFGGLGFYVGVWAVLVADLAGALRLSPALLGIALSCFSSAGIVLLLAGNSLANRLTRRRILLLGAGGLGLFFAMLVFVAHYALLLAVLLLGGASASCYDLAVNTIGGDYERCYARKTMTLFHAGFSAGATLGALSSAAALAGGAGFRTIYAAVAIVFLLLAGATFLLPLPSTGSTGALREESTAHTKYTLSIVKFIAIPVVALATTLVSLSFFTDGVLEGYSSVYLRALPGGVLAGGAGIAAFYFTSMIGRLGSTTALRRYGERVVITVAAMLSLFGLIVTLSAPSALLAASGLLLVGLGQSPMVPTAFSLAARVGAQQGTRAVAIVTAAGYGIFLAGPLFIGFLATLLSLRVALLSTLAAATGVVLIAQRLPGSQQKKRKFFCQGRLN